MKHRLVTATLAIAALASPALAQPEAPLPVPPLEYASEISVIGIGAAERPADWAAVSFEARGEGATSVEALRALETRRHRLEDALGRLAGARAIRVDATDLKVAAVRGADCETDRYGGTPVLSKGDCAVLGHVATLSFKITLSPAAKAGDAASLAAQLGGFDVSLAGRGLDDPNGLADRATDAAVADARRDAQAIARAAGRRLGPVVRVQDAEAGGLEFAAPADMPALEVARLQPRPAVAPEVSVAVTVPPVEDTVRLIVVFRLEP